MIVLVSDGGNTTSSRTFKDALQSAQRADAVMYPVVVVPIENDAGRNTGGEHALQTIAHDTGGRWFPATLNELDTAFAEILRDLRAQYMLAYYPRALREDAPRSIRCGSSFSAGICRHRRALAIMEMILR